jgi:hypothetical protein
MLRLRSATNKNPLSVRKLVIRYPEPVTSTPLSVRKTSFSITNHQSKISGHLDTIFLRDPSLIQKEKSCERRKITRSPVSFPSHFPNGRVGVGLAVQSTITNQKSPVTSIQFFCAIRLSYKKRNRVSAEKSLGVRFLLPPIFQRGGPGWGWLFIYKSPIKNLRSPRYIPTRYQYSSLQKCGEACRNTRRPKKLLFNQKSPITNQKSIEETK